MTQYHVYKNNLLGGPVDYTTPLATVAGLTYTAAALPASSDATFAVRAFDDVTLLEERNVDAAVRVVTDAAGADVTARPNAPARLMARPTANGGAEVRWSFNPGGRGAAPTGFHVYAGTPAISYAAPVATVPYVAGRVTYTVALSGLTDGATYRVGVRAYNAAAEEPNAATVALLADAAGPSPVEGLSAVATVSP